VDWEVAQNDPASVTAQRLFSVATLYQRVVTAVPRKPQTGNVFLIEISGLPGVSDSNTCKERTYIGDLLRTLALAQPRVVVIDGYFDNNRCDGANDKLVDGAKMLCQANAKLVVGRAVNEDALKKDLPVYPLDEALDFRKAGAACVSEGLVNLDPDFRRVSLWFPNVQAVAYSVPPPPSLPLAAALAYKDDLGVARWPHEADPPYVSFLAPHEFDKFKRNASEVLCGPPEDWRACEDTQIRKDVKNLALGKVVVIGELDHRDKHPTVLGELDGYMLQANYIESLIDNRLFRPVPEWFDWLAGLAIFVCFDYLSWRHQGIHIVAACAMLVAGVLLGVYFALHIVGFYVNPALVIILTILYSRVIGFFLGKR
jgi:CHASE2 domain-containing sensor protein